MELHTSQMHSGDPESQCDFNADPRYAKPLRWQCSCVPTWSCGCWGDFKGHTFDPDFGQYCIIHDAEVQQCSYCGATRPPGAFGNKQREWNECRCSRCGVLRPQEPEREKVPAELPGARWAIELIAITLVLTFPLALAALGQYFTS